MNIKTTEKGIAIDVEAVCNAVRPPNNNIKPATHPMIAPQKIRSAIGGCFFPRQRMVQMTSVAESEEVINQVAINMVVSNAMAQVAHSTSNNS